MNRDLINKIPKRKILIGIIAFILIALPAAILPSRLVIAFGHSVNYNLFWKKTDDKNLNSLTYDDYVVIETPKENKFTQGVNIIKKVGCKEGDTLIVSVKDYFCRYAGKNDTNYLGKAKDKSKEGIPVQNFNPCSNGNFCVYTIPKGYFFAIGEHPDSYDSRYLGVINVEKIIAVASPII